MTLSTIQQGATCLQQHKKWYETFRDEGCLCINHWLGRPGPSQETVNHSREVYKHSPKSPLNVGV